MLRDCASLLDLARLKDSPGFERVREMFDIDLQAAAPLVMNDRGWKDTRKVMQVPRREVEQQVMVLIRDRRLGTEASYNPLRSKRFAAPKGPSAADIIDADLAAGGCRWCDPDDWHVDNRDLWADGFGTVTSTDGRIGARANWARMFPIGGIVFGEPSLHNFLRVAQDDSEQSFDVAEKYIAMAHGAHQDTRYYSVIQNGGRKSAGSVDHAHLQVLGRAGRRHFPFAEMVRERCPADYWQRLNKLHDELGLAVNLDGCTAWADLCPPKERGITAMSETLSGGAAQIWRILEVLKSHGTNQWSLAAILKPSYVTGSASDDGGFEQWPNVLWRLVDRGDMRVRHSDIGSTELLLNAVVIANDPFDVARWLQNELS